MSADDDYRNDVWKSQVGPVGTADPGFPGLRVNPAPGIPSAILTLAANVNKAVEQTGTILGSIDRATAPAGPTGSWYGPAADGMRRTFGELRPKIATMDASFRAVHHALQAWGQQLTYLQQRANTLEMEARSARDRVEQTEHGAVALFTADNEQEVAAAVQAARDHKAAQQALDDVIDRAAQLYREHQLEAKSVAEVVKAAAEKGPKAPRGALSTVARALDKVGDVAGLLSTVAGLTALAAAGVAVAFPPAAPFATPVAGVAGAAAAALAGLSLISHGAADAMGESEPGYTYFSDAVGATPVILFRGGTVTLAQALVMSAPFTVAGSANDLSTAVSWVPPGVDPIETAWNWAFDREDSKSESIPVMTDQDRSFVTALREEQAKLTTTPSFQK